MFAAEIIMQSNDGHKIFDKATGELLNQKPYKIEIGDHVWVGMQVTMLKDVSIPSNTVIGARSVVNKSFDEENTIIDLADKEIILYKFDLSEVKFKMFYDKSVIY